MELRNCKYKPCSQLFEPKRKNQLFHTAKCRKAWYEENYFVKEDTVKVCPVCGREFHTSCPSKQTYCKENDNECKKTARMCTAFGIEPAIGGVADGACELCGQPRKVAAYRHDGVVTSLCLPCTAVARGVDSGLVEKYKGLSGTH